MIIRSPTRLSLEEPTPKDVKFLSTGPNSGRAPQRGNLLRAGPVPGSSEVSQGAGPSWRTYPGVCGLNSLVILAGLESRYDCQARTSCQGVPAAEHVQLWVEGTVLQVGRSPGLCRCRQRHCAGATPGLLGAVQAGRWLQSQVPALCLQIFRG